MPRIPRLKLHPFDFTLLGVALWFLTCLVLGVAAKRFSQQFQSWIWLVWFAMCLWLTRVVPAILLKFVCPSCPKCRRPVEPHKGRSITYRCSVCDIVIDTGITSEGD
jgi:hypothetical protein